MTLLSGEPGIGKSTLILQTGYEIAKQYGTVLYVSGEESEEQIKMRAERLHAIADKLMVVSETNVYVIEQYIEDYKPVFVIIDSIQTLFTPELSSAPGSVSQVRECANHIVRIGKMKKIPVFMIAHVTKTGEIAGPRVLEHLVDTVVHFSGERGQELRVIRAFKNRLDQPVRSGFRNERRRIGTGTQSIGDIFRGIHTDTEGAVVVASLEGSRPLLVEIQALVVPTI